MDSRTIEVEEGEGEEEIMAMEDGTSNLDSQVGIEKGTGWSLMIHMAERVYVRGAKVRGRGIGAGIGRGREIGMRDVEMTVEIGIAMIEEIGIEMGEGRERGITTTEIEDDIGTTGIGRGGTETSMYRYKVTAVLDWSMRYAYPEKVYQNMVHRVDVFHYTLT